MHSARRYVPLKRDLETYGNVQVTLYEFPGFGDTPFKEAAACSIMEEYLKDLCAYLEKHHFDYMIGHSMGGSLALRAVAANHSQERLILLSPEYGGIAFLRPLVFLKPLVRVLLELVKAENRAGTFLIKLASLFTINKFSKIDDVIVGDVRKADGNAAARLMFELACDTWKVEKGGGPAGKVLLVVGEKDRIISKKHMARLKGDVADCRLCVLKGIGHTAVVEDYRGLLNVVLGWMDRGGG